MNRSYGLSLRIKSIITNIDNTQYQSLARTSELSNHQNTTLLKTCIVFKKDNVIFFHQKIFIRYSKKIINLHKYSIRVTQTTRRDNHWFIFLVQKACIYKIKMNHLKKEPLTLKKRESFNVYLVKVGWDNVVNF